MSLSEILANPPKSGYCKFGVWVHQQSAEDQEAIGKALENKLWSVPQLIVVFKAAGADMGKTVISEHRRKACSCEFV